MVARPDPPGPAGRRADDDPVSGLFHTWRRLVTHAARAPGDAARAASGSRAARALRLAVRYAADPAGILAAADASDRERLKEAGAAGLVVGAAVSFAVSSALGTPALRAFLAMGWTAAWALARLLIMRLVASDSRKDERRAVEAAWGPALLPYIAAVVFPIDILALALSARLTHRGLVAVGIPRARATRAVAWAFGGQLAVETVAWMGRAGMLAFVRL